MSTQLYQNQLSNNRDRYKYQGKLTTGSFRYGM